MAHEVYRLCVQIVSFIPDDELEKGDHIELKGHMDKSLPGSSFLKVADMQYIKLIEGSANVTPRMLKIAILGPKPKASEGSPSNVKRVSEAKNDSDEEEKEIHEKR